MKEEQPDPKDEKVPKRDKMAERIGVVVVEGIPFPAIRTDNKGGRLINKPSQKEAKNN